MSLLALLSFSPQKMALLLAGILIGYLLVMRTNPARADLQDGAKCVRRYPVLWFGLGLCGFAYALFQLALRAYFFQVLPLADRPPLMWMREGWRDPQLWLTGSPESLWFLPVSTWRAALVDAPLPALENVAGIFNLLVPTFPLSAFAALLFLTNWGGHHAELGRALRRRFPRAAWPLHLGLLSCALAALAKPFLYAAPQLFHLQEQAAHLWFQWAPVAEWLSFLFEYLSGVYLQICLILVAFCWVRGRSFTAAHLLDFAVRRFSLVVRWALVVMALSSVVIHAPLILKNFDLTAPWFSSDPETVEARLRVARWILSATLLVFASVQITLTLHSESLGKAFFDHARFMVRAAWPLAWFLIIAGLHFWLWQIAFLVIARGLGEGTAPGIAWSLLASWLQALISAWLLASWVVSSADLNRLASLGRKARLARSPKWSFPRR